MPLRKNPKAVEALPKTGLALPTGQKNPPSRTQKQNTAEVDSEPAPRQCKPKAQKKDLDVSGSKRPQNTEDQPESNTHTTEIATKKQRTGNPNHLEELELAPMQTQTQRQPSRTTKVTKSLTTPRKWRTREEVLADKARVEEEKRQQEELNRDNEQRMLEMDIEEDVDRARTTTHVVRKFADIKNDSGEEFVGYNDVGLGSEDDSEVVVNKKVCYVTYVYSIIPPRHGRSGLTTSYLDFVSIKSQISEGEKWWWWSEKSCRWEEVSQSRSFELLIISD